MKQFVYNVVRELDFGVLVVFLEFGFDDLEIIKWK